MFLTSRILKPFLPHCWTGQLFPKRDCIPFTGCASISSRRRISCIYSQTLFLLTRPKRQFNRCSLNSRFIWTLELDTNLGLKCHLDRVVSFFYHSFKGLCVYIPMRSLLIQVTYIGKLATFVLTKLPMLKTPLSLGMLFVLSYDCVGKPCLRCFLIIVIILILLATQAETLKKGGQTH